MKKLVLWRRPDAVSKADDAEADLDVEGFVRDQLDELCAKGEADPEIQELVRKCIADPGNPSPAVSKGAERVEVRKEDRPMTGRAETTGRSLEQLDADLAAAVATNQAIEAEKALAKRDVAAAGAIFKANPRAYEAFLVRARGQEYRVPVEVAKAEPDYTAEIKRLCHAGDTSALGKLLRKPGAYAQYKRLLAAGELARAAA